MLYLHSKEDILKAKELAIQAAKTNNLVLEEENINIYFFIVEDI